jgi:hypothetical protein
MAAALLLMMMMMQNSAYKRPFTEQKFAPP